MSDTIYCYPNSNVLINKLGIKDKDKLSVIERKLTMLRLLELFEKPIYGKFDLRHLQSIHGYIFQDVYEWSGKIRTVDIAKETMFCNVKFIRMLALKNGYKIHYSRITAEEMVSASKESFLCRYNSMENIIRKCIQ